MPVTRGIPATVNIADEAASAVSVYILSVADERYGSLACPYIENIPIFLKPRSTALATLTPATFLSPGRALTNLLSLAPILSSQLVYPGVLANKPEPTISVLFNPDLANNLAPSSNLSIANFKTSSAPAPPF